MTNLNKLIPEAQKRYESVGEELMSSSTRCLQIDY